MVNETVAYIMGFAVIFAGVGVAFYITYLPQIDRWWEKMKHKRAAA